MVIIVSLNVHYQSGFVSQGALTRQEVRGYEFANMKIGASSVCLFGAAFVEAQTITETEALHPFTHEAQIPANADLASIRFVRMKPVKVATEIKLTEDVNYCKEVSSRDPGGSQDSPHSQLTDFEVADQLTYSYIGPPVAPDEHAPSESAGKKVRALTSTMVPRSSMTNSGPFVGRVPLVAIRRRLRARFPAIASAGMVIRKRPISISIPSVRLNHGVFAFRPAKALCQDGWRIACIECARARLFWFVLPFEKAAGTGEVKGTAIPFGAD
jgi:hypothetical protein